MKTLKAAVAAVLISALGISQPALATNRTQFLHGQNPPSSWFNQYMRDNRLGQGAYWWNALAGSSTSYGGTFANLSVLPVTGLFVAVGPTAANSVGTLYQYLQEETTAYGGYPSGTGSDALAADATKAVLQGTMLSNGSSIGPLSPPGTAGQSIDYLIECQVQTIDTTSQAINVVSTTGVVTSTTANRDRNDIVTCQSKAGTAATTGSQTVPSVDSGWIGVGYVAVANGTVTITSGMVTALSANAFGGFIALNGQNVVTLPPATGTPPASSVAMYNDGAATNGWAFNIPSGSTNGYQFNIGGVAGVNFTAAGGNVNVPGAVVAGSTIVNGPSTLTYVGGDLLAGRSATQGAVHLGGNTSHVDCDWNVTTGSTFTCSQPVAAPQFTASSSMRVTQNTVPGYVPPVFNANGTATGSTLHTDIGSCTTNASGQCVVTLTSPASFASTAYQVTCNSASSTATFCNYLITSATQFTIYVFSQSGAAVGAGNGVSWSAIGA